MRRLGLLLLLAIAAAGGFSAWLDPKVNRPFKGYRPASIFVDIPKGTSRWEVAGILFKNGVVRNRMAFEILVRFHQRFPLQAGEYLFDRPMSGREVFWKIAEGRIYVQKVTVREGWTMFDIADELEKVGVMNGDDFLRVARDPTPILDLAPHAHSLEGFLFPSSYEFTRRVTPELVAETMIKQFRKEWASLRPSAEAPLPAGLDVSQVVTVASLVERETPLPEERPVVAGVFYNRLKRNEPLQCDPTVQYALALKGEMVRTITHEDLATNSPYNTYKHPGLPPGPIANPGEVALRAAIDPAQTDFLYFVANDEGGHFFSRTLAEHNRNVARYRRLLEESAPPEDSGAASKKHRRSS
jgi:UPF0755 protein